MPLSGSCVTTYIKQKMLNDPNRESFQILQSPMYKKNLSRNDGMPIKVIWDTNIVCRDKSNQIRPMSLFVISSYSSLPKLHYNIQQHGSIAVYQHTRILLIVTCEFTFNYKRYHILSRYVWFDDAVNHSCMSHVSAI